MSDVSEYFDVVEHVGFWSPIQLCSANLGGFFGVRCPSVHLGVSYNTGENIPDRQWIFLVNYYGHSWDMILLLLMLSCYQYLGECFIVLLRWLCFNFCLQRVIIIHNLLYFAHHVHQYSDCHYGYFLYDLCGRLSLLLVNYKQLGTYGGMWWMHQCFCWILWVVINFCNCSKELSSFWIFNCGKWSSEDTSF